MLPSTLLPLAALLGAAVATPVSSAKPAASSSSYLKPASAFEFSTSDLPGVEFDVRKSYAGQMPLARPAKGETVDLDDKDAQKMYFIYMEAETPTKESDDEIVIWLNGGPGCSSLGGFLQENGPIMWASGMQAPAHNPYSWTNLTNMVWVEQPVGTGFSTGEVKASNVEDSSQEFLNFWKNFVDTFKLHNRKVYLAGESYAGQYIPYIAAAMLDKDDKKYFNVAGTLIYSPVLNYEAPDAALNRYLDRNPSHFPIDPELRQKIRTQSEKCGFEKLMDDGLQFPPSGHVHLESSESDPLKCMFQPIVAYSLVLGQNPCFSYYQLASSCPAAYDPLGMTGTGMALPDPDNKLYFNQPEVKKVLHAPADIKWAACRNGTDVFTDGDDESPTTGINGGKLKQVIEGTNNVIIGHGTFDYVLLSNYTLLQLNNLTWNGAQGFEEGPVNEFYVPHHPDVLTHEIASGAGVLGRWTKSRGLTFLEADLSGHMLPTDQPGAGFRTLEVLLGRVPDFADKTPLTGTTGEGDWWDLRQIVGNGTIWDDVESGDDSDRVTEEPEEPKRAARRSALLNMDLIKNKRAELYTEAGPVEIYPVPASWGIKESRKRLAGGWV